MVTLEWNNGNKINSMSTEAQYSLFDVHPSKIRTLGWWQPFGSLMLPPHNKIETRVVANGRKPPFPLGEYLIYTTKKSTNQDDLITICGYDNLKNVAIALLGEETANLNGFAIGIGDLTHIRPMTPEDEEKCFVVYSPNRVCLIFSNVRRIKPFPFLHGKQGIGFLTDDDAAKIQLI